ncbi:MAG: dihydrodipicolinate synthase family protein [Candidatus Hydrogenedentes bacterium]|nr:dihydrodipicolinate synthase family protein [Candidatus Hydrogenedentota bacterium]
MPPTTDLRGIITVLNTPFNADDTLDLPGLARNVENAIQAGVAGFLMPAMASEVGALTEDERAAVVRATVDTAAGRVPVIGGASAPDQAARLAAARTLTGLGCAGVLVSIPFTDEAAYTRDVEELAALDPGFLMLQDWDANGYGLPVPLIVRLFETVPAFQCLKIEVVPAGPKYTEVLEATGGKLHVSGGWAVGQMIEGLDRGVHAFMPTGMHRIYTTIYRRYTQGDREGARALFEELLPVLAFSNQHLDISICFFKRLLHAQGIYATDRVRSPQVAFDAIHQKTADDLIRRVIALEARLTVDS